MERAHIERKEKGLGELVIYMFIYVSTAFICYSIPAVVYDNFCWLVIKKKTFVYGNGYRKYKPVGQWRDLGVRRQQAPKCTACAHHPTLHMP